MIDTHPHGARHSTLKRCRVAGPVTLLGCLMILSACSARENGASDRDIRNRAYVSAGALVSYLDPDTSGVAGTSVDDPNGTGGVVALGYDLSNRISVEGHVASLGEATIDPEGTIGYTVGGISGLYYGLNSADARARREGFAVFGRLGLGGLENDAKGVEIERINDLHLLAGAGLEYGLSSGVGFRAELVAHETDAKFAQLGVVYRFGSPPRIGPHKPVAPSGVDDVPIVGPNVDKLPPLPAANPKPAIASSPVKSAPAKGRRDADGDRVPDNKDQCPDTDAGTPVKVDGCPVFSGAIEGINFQPGSDTLTAQAGEILAGIVKTLQEYPDIRIAIQAHTDNQGEATANLQLSKRRAIAVARYLINAGISGSRLRPQAYGESRPRSSNQTAQGRAANRRVEISVIQ